MNGSTVLKWITGTITLVLFVVGVVRGGLPLGLSAAVIPGFFFLLCFARGIVRND